MLLPLSSTKVRALSLENHLALATVRAGHGDLDQICCLIRVVYLAYFMRSEMASGADLEPYRHAEAVLDVCIKRLERNEPCQFLDPEQRVVECILVLHDEQLAAVPRFRYLEAWERLQRFVASGRQSPFPVGTAG